MTTTDAERRATSLFESHYDEVLAYCTRRVGRSDAEDATTEVFAVAWRRIEEIDWETARPWLYGIARGVLANRSRSLRRQSRLLTRLSGLPQRPPEPPEAYVVQRDEDRAVSAAMSRLKQSDQEVLMLAAWEDLSGSEIAAALGISISAAEQRLHRAKKRLAKVLRPTLPKPQVSPRAAEDGGGS